MIEIAAIIGIVKRRTSEILPRRMRSASFPHGTDDPFSRLCARGSRQSSPSIKPVSVIFPVLHSAKREETGTNTKMRKEKSIRIEKKFILILLYRQEKSKKISHLAKKRVFYIIARIFYISLPFLCKPFLSLSLYFSSS